MIQYYDSTLESSKKFNYSSVSDRETNFVFIEFHIELFSNCFFLQQNVSVIILHYLKYTSQYNIMW